MIDRAAAVTTTILQVVGRALRMRYHDGDQSAIPDARLEVEELLRGEFRDITRQVRDELRLD